MISANQLPAQRSVYEYPALLPGEELTEEQKEQALTAQVAGIVLAVAATKSSLQAAITNQIVALLHSANLTTEVGIKAFAKAAAKLVSTGSRKAQEATWVGVKMRTAAVGIPFSKQIPRERDLPQDVRLGRKTDLETAYARLAEEYKKNLERKTDDPVIQELVAQYETEEISPLLRPDNISSDAVERIANGKADWAKAFEEASEAQGGSDPEGPSDEEISRNSLAERRREAAEEQAKRLEEFNAAIAKTRGERQDQARAAESQYQELVREQEALRLEEERRFRLSEPEKEAVVRRYAEHKAGERAERMVSQDIAGASRNIYQIAIDSIPDNAVVGYRRVVHPELSESGKSCGLCIVASTMEYKKSDLLPIHSGCNCETCEIYSKDGLLYDPGHMINMEDLEVFYREAGNSSHGWDLKKSRYEIVDHPEYGPTLINAHPNKTGKIKKEHIPING